MAFFLTSNKCCLFNLKDDLGDEFLSGCRPGMFQPEALLFLLTSLFGVVAPHYACLMSLMNALLCLLNNDNDGNNNNNHSYMPVRYSNVTFVHKQQKET